jgi:alkanesulfonate monooxygenase SsuD/methylene tetrahydromethanopterin reductase-like flavin-dependent oxidoreductase (luciferase family)
VRRQIGLYIGAFGSREQNFYADLIRRYGFEADVEAIQGAALDGRLKDAIAAVSDELVDALALVGPVARVRDRLQAYAEAGATSVLCMTKDEATIRGVGEVGT